MWSPHLIDLTRPMTKQTGIDLAGKMMAEPNPYGEVQVKYLRDWDTDNGRVCELTLSDHFGTHVDAPVHVVSPDAAGPDRLDIDRLIGEAVVIDCSFANGRGITAEDLDRAGADVRAGDIVLIYSAEQPGTIDEFVMNQTFVLPSGAQWIVDKGAKAVGVEPFGFEHLYQGLEVDKHYDKESPPPHWPAHQIVLGNDVYVIEGLANLASIVGKRVHFAALPMAIPGASGSPVRAVAWESSYSR